MKQRVIVLVVAAVTAAMACKSADSKPAAGSAGASSSGDPWAKPAVTTGSAASGSAAAGSDSAADPTCPPPPKTPTPEAVTTKLARPFFFHATKAGMGNVWLFGTIHLGVAPDAIPDAVLAKLGKAERFAMETDINDPTLLASLMRTDGKKLSDELGAATWHKFECVIGKKQARMIDGMKASTAATLLDVQGMPITQPMDMFLLLRAKKDGKGIIFLEPGAKQLALLDKWMDAKEIETDLDELDLARKKNAELIDAYVAGDDAKAVEMSKDDSDYIKAGHTHEQFTQMMKELLLDRNASWIDEIEDMAKKGDGFVAVGAMHLLGPGSVVEMLAKRGWKIERVAP